MSNSTAITKQAYDAAKIGDLNALVCVVDADIGVVNASTPFGSLLHVAADKGHLDAVRFLVERGADVDVNGGVVGGSPLCSAASSGHIEIVRYLLDRGAVIDVTEPTRNPLFAAIYGGHYEVARLLIEHGIDASVVYNGENMQDMDAEAFAREWGRPDIVRLLSDR